MKSYTGTTYSERSPSLILDTPPYYGKNFFALLLHYHEDSPLNITILSTSQWYQLLLEDQVLMSPATESSPPCLLPVRCETLYPGADWSSAWRLVRTRGLQSNISSFLLKLLHLLLPTQARVLRLGADRNNAAGHCLLCGAEGEDLLHAFFSCPSTSAAGLATLGWAQTLVPNLSQECALRLEIIDPELDYDEELAITSILGTGLCYIWEARLKKKRVESYEVRAELEALVSLLRRTRHNGAGDIIAMVML